MILIEKFEGKADLAQVDLVDGKGGRVGQTYIDPCSLGLSFIQSRIAEGQDESINGLSSLAILALLCGIQAGRRYPS